MQIKDKWYYSTWFIALLFAFWFFIIPGIAGIVLLILQMKQRNQLYKNVQFKDLVSVRNELNEKDKTINQLNEQVKSLKQEIATDKKSIKQLSQNVTTLEQDVEETEDELSDADQKISILQDQLAKLKSQKNKDKSPKSQEQISVQHDDQRSEPPKALSQQNYKERYIKARTLSENYTVIDFETTGLKPENSEIIQIGAVKYENGTIVDSFSTYVKPTRSKISRTITRITGITEKTVASAPVINDILPDFLNFIEKQTLVAHNASFDMKFLIASVDYCGLTMDRVRVIDTLPLARRTIPNTTNHKLETLKKELNLGDHDSHDALGDCYTTGSLYQTCFSKLNA